MFYLILQLAILITDDAESNVTVTISMCFHLASCPQPTISIPLTYATSTEPVHHLCYYSGVKGKKTGHVPQSNDGALHQSCMCAFCMLHECSHTRHEVSCVMQGPVQVTSNK